MYRRHSITLVAAGALIAYAALTTSSSPADDGAPTAGGVQGGSGAEAAVAAMLDDLHAAAAAADGPRYFGHFSPEAVFLGTDATERWTLAEFRAFAMPLFEKGKGWTYRATSRHVQPAPGGTVAWFDELLDNAAYGTCRGSGAARLVDGTWKLAQYDLSIPIPNALAKELVAKIRAAAGAGPDPARPK